MDEVPDLGSRAENGSVIDNRRGMDEDLAHASATRSTIIARP